MNQLVVGQVIEGKEVAAIGFQYDFRDSSGHIAPVKFQDNSYAVVTWSDTEPPEVWESNVPEIKRALANSVEMPMVNHGIGNGSVHVRGADKIGKFFIKLTYGWRYMEHGDEFSRL